MIWSSFQGSGEGWVAEVTLAITNVLTRSLKNTY